MSEQKWRLEWNGNRYVIRDETGKAVSRSSDKRMAVQAALLQAWHRQQSVVIVERET